MQRELRLSTYTMIENTYNYLSAVLGYPLHIPDAPSTQFHRIGFSNGHHYVAPKKRIYTTQKNSKQSKDLMGSRKKIYNILKRQNSYKTANEIEKLAKFTRNHCSIIMADLYKMGFLERHQVKKDGTRFYVYKVK